MYKVLGVGLVAFMMLFSLIPTSNAELWELIIELNVEKGAIYSGENLVITGKVVDHAYQPIRGAEIFIRTGADTTKAFTDPWGVFRAEFSDFERVPGTYTVNVVASWYGMTGLTSTQFQVKGEASQVSLLQQQLSTDQARKYLSSHESDFEKDPIGQTLFKYYHGLLEQLILEKKEANKPDLKQIHIDKQRQIAEELRSQAIEEENPGYGVYGGYQYEYYINSLRPEIRDMVISQLDFTKNTFEEAQNLRAEILENGGTYEEAQKAYLEIISIPKEVLEEFNQKYQDEKSSEDSTEQ